MMRPTMTCAATAALLLTPLSAAAQSTETFTLPAGCEATLTVQSKSCEVEHHFTCEGDPDGHKQRVALNEDGITYLGTINAETEWVQSFHPMSGHTERLEDEPADRASFSELTTTDADTYDFRTLSDEVGATRYVGADTLTGRTVEIDGVTLDETSYQITAYDEDGNEKWSARGNEFISREFGRFFAGSGTVTVPEGTFDKDDSPVEFIFPGEPGFLSANPKFGCGETMSSFTVVE